MPLLDHAKLPARDRRSWEGFHATWAVSITQLLNTQGLPPNYHAEPLTQAGSTVEADVSTYEEESAEPLENGNGGVATAVYAPPQPPVVLQVDFGALDIFEVRVYDDDGTRALVAAIELISPSNKDRSAHREAFATKCAAYLQQSVSVVIVDIVTERRANLHEEIMKRVQVEGGQVNSELYAVAYRTADMGAKMRLEAWPSSLSIGAKLPTMPLWIAPQLAVPLDLEASYEVARTALRIST